MLTCELGYFMKKKLSDLSERYLTALQDHLREVPRMNVQTASCLGRRALRIGLRTLDLARIHEQALATLSSPGDLCEIWDETPSRAEIFFADAVTPIEETHHAVMEANARLKQQIAALYQRTGELAASNQQLKQEVLRRKAAETALKTSEQHHKLLLDQSWQMQEQLRDLSHQILIAQENERQEISRELHDEIAQILAAISIHLDAIRIEAAVSVKDLPKKIESTQRLVRESVKTVNRFARALRPTVLDDLGIIPALHSYMKDFTKQTGLQVQFTVFDGVEQKLNSINRTALFRVAQAALDNVGQHAQATHATVSIKKLPGTVCMEINDNGIGFEPERALFSKTTKYLGLIGMRERVEMVGGSFSVESVPGKGTTIRTQIPFTIPARTQTR